MDTVELAIKWREKWKNKQGEIVGVDFSGNPSITDVTPFMPALRRAKDAGFKLSLHISEVNVVTGDHVHDRTMHAWT